MKTISFETTKADGQLISQIVKRAVELFKAHRITYPHLECDMDLVACHVNANPLDLPKLMAADDFNLLHDLLGIRQHLNRETGTLENCFSPRCSKHQ